MARSVRVVLDDRLLIEELLVGLAGVPGDAMLSTTSLWYFRACRASALGAGGHLSGPFARFPADLQARAVAKLLTIRDDIGLPDPRITVPAMAEVATRHPTLRLINVEAVAAARVSDATVWLSVPSASGVLPAVLDDEGIDWRTVAI